ncbi:MAG: 3-isopropylmalate dehydratase [Terrimonas sp.]|mgnify:CR=1 FL=1|nr:3-isopropylmalate dehydratase [Terrimonas sp.]OJY97967.1 MAG: hypothetical protein BGP13_09895 [Sphingobacteriales bacterium 40-81]
MKRYVTDLNGKQLLVTDLNKAIQQAAAFKEYRHVPPVKSDKERQQYWNDLYNKLSLLKTTLLNQKKRK